MKEGIAASLLSRKQGLGVLIHIKVVSILVKLREFVQPTVILAPDASEVGLGAAALAPLWRDTSLPGLSSARSPFYAQASQTLQILKEKDIHS